MQVLYPGRIGIWRCWFLWTEENRRTQRKTLGARQEPTTNSTHMQLKVLSRAMDLHTTYFVSSFSGFYHVQETVKVKIP